MADSFIQQLIQLFDNEDSLNDLLSPLNTGVELEVNEIHGAVLDQTESVTINQVDNSNEAGEAQDTSTDDPIGFEEIEEYVSESDIDLTILNNLFAKFNLSVEEIFRLLNASILHGEYFTISDVDSLKDQMVEKSVSFIGALKTELVNYEHYFNPLSIYFRVIDKAIKDFSDLITSLRNKVKSTKKIYYTINGDINSLIDEKKYSGEIPLSYYVLETSCLTQYKLFNLNLTASRNEFLMQSTDFERLLSELLIDIRWIDGLNGDLILSDAIKAKCQYLWSKIQHRIILESDDEIVFSDGVSEIPLVNGTDPFKLWTETIDRHYDESGQSNNITIEIVTKDLNLSSKEVRSITLLLELHLLIKYYKDCTDNNYQDKLEEIRKEIDRRYSDLKSNPLANKFDAFAYSFALNYAINNEFSALLDDITVDYSTVKQLYLEVCKVQERTSVDNFFPQWRYLKYLIDKIKIDLKHDIKEHNLGNISKLLAEARSIYKKYHKNIYWSQNTYNYVFYLPQEECSIFFVDAKEIISKIFVASSFNLPLFTDKYLQDYNQSGIELTNLERSVAILELINDEQRDIKEKSDVLSEELKNKETKYIEILGIFGAVITFASGAFTTQLGLIKDANREQILSGMLSIGVVLFLFILLLLFVTRIPLEKLWRQSKHLQLRKFGVACTIGFICFLFTTGACFLFIDYRLRSISQSQNDKPINQVKQLITEPKGLEAKAKEAGKVSGEKKKTGSKVKG